jgi:APA family basic amino acid/polyamine antiporter
MLGSDTRGRAIGPLQLLALGVNGIVGVGIFFVPAVAAAHAPGFGTVLVFLGTGLALLPAAAAFAILGRRFDQDGGPVVFARAAFGPRVSFLVGWVAYLSAVFSTSAVVAGLVRASAPAGGLRHPLALRAASAGLVLVLSLVIASGLRLSARVWTTLTVLKLLPLAVLLAAFTAARPSLPPAGTAVPSGAWLAAGLAVMFSLQGFEIVPVIAGQARASSRAVPFATVGSLLLAIILYCGLAFACVAALPSLASSAAPLADAAAALSGSGLARLVAAGTSVSALGIAFGMMVTTPRYLSSLAAGAGRFSPLERSSRREVPVPALAITTILVGTTVGLGELSELFALSSIAVLAQYGVTAAALQVLAGRRERGLGARDRWPVLPTLAVALVLVVFGASLREGLVALATLAFGWLLLRWAGPLAAD